MPVVSYRAGAVPEVVEHDRSGILVEPFDHAGLAAAILYLMQNPDAARAMGRCGAETVRRRFSRDRTADLMLERLSSLRHGWPGGRS